MNKKWKEREEQIFVYSSSPPKRQLAPKKLDHFIYYPLSITLGSEHTSFTTSIPFY